MLFIITLLGNGIYCLDFMDFLVFLLFIYINCSYALLFKAYELLFKVKLFEDTVNFNKTLNQKLNKEK